MRDYENSPVQTKVKNLLKKADHMYAKGMELEELADKSLADGNSLEWEDATKSSIENEAFARGIEYALEKLGYITKQ